MGAMREGLVAVVLLIAGPLFANLGIAPPIAGFGLFAGGGLMGVVALLRGVRNWARNGASAGAANVAIGAVVVGIVVVAALPGRSVPRINDITTDTATPPQFVAAGTLPANVGRDMKYPGEEFARQQNEGYPSLRALELPLSPEQAFGRALETAQSMPGWDLTRKDAENRAIEGTSTSRVFRFQDDFVIEVRPAAAGSGSVVHMRSKSRDGKGDLGVNAARITSFLGRLREAAN